MKFIFKESRFSVLLKESKLIFIFGEHNIKDICKKIFLNQSLKEKRKV